MAKETYHHGTLRQDMIDKGLLLLNKDGFENFSLRKVATMCGVSHTAPYKHFKDKNELLAAIIAQVTELFSSSLLKSAIEFPLDPRRKMIEMGKAYVEFMVENPEYLKFLFLSNHHCPIIMEDQKFFYEDKIPFGIFKESAASYLDSLNLDKDIYPLEILAMWSLVHGLATLISNKNIEYQGDYLQLVEKVLLEKL